MSTSPPPTGDRQPQAPSEGGASEGGASEGGASHQPSVEARLGDVVSRLQSLEALEAKVSALETANRDLSASSLLLRGRVSELEGETKDLRLRLGLVLEGMRGGAAAAAASFPPPHPAAFAGLATPQYIQQAAAAHAAAASAFAAVTPDFTFAADGTCIPYKKRKYAPSSSPPAVQVPYILREEGGGSAGSGRKATATKPRPSPKSPANKGKKKAKTADPSSSPSSIPSSLPVERDDSALHMLGQAASSSSSLGTTKKSRLSPQVSDVQEHDAVKAPPLPSKKKTTKSPVVINLTRPGDDLLLLPDGTRLTAAQAPGIGWSASEDEALSKIMSGTKWGRKSSSSSQPDAVDWDEVARAHGRSAKEAHYRWDRYLNNTPRSVKFHHWTEAEDALIYRAVHVAQQAEKNGGCPEWSAMACTLPGRKGKQVRERWRNCLDPKLEHGPFTREDDVRLWDGQKVHGRKWAEIATSVFDGSRSENQVKNRWYSAAFKKVVAVEFGQEACEEAFAPSSSKQPRW